MKTGAPRWRLQISLELGSRRRTVFLDFAERRHISEQLAQIDRRDVPEFDLLHFTNESGERLAVVRCAYSGHEVIALDGCPL